MSILVGGEIHKFAVCEVLFRMNEEEEQEYNSITSQKERDRFLMKLAWEEAMYNDYWYQGIDEIKSTAYIVEE